MELPAISHVDFLEYLDFNFEATGRPTDEDALNHLLNITGAHPKRTQQLAWAAWEATKRRGRPVTVEVVQDAYERMLAGPEAAPFETVLDVLSSGDEGQANEMRALFLLADRGAEKLTSRQHLALYGFTTPSMIPRALERLRARGLTQRAPGSGVWRIADPFFAGWLREQSPLAARASDVAPPFEDRPMIARRATNLVAVRAKFSVALRRSAGVHDDADTDEADRGADEVRAVGVEAVEATPHSSEPTMNTPP